MPPKLTWTVTPPSTGRYRSFFPRGWPTATYPDGQMAAAIYCQDEYVPAQVRAGSHGELEVRVADHSVSPWK
jgi:hypothetical protein